MNDLRFAPFDATIDRRFNELRADMRAGFARLEAKIDSQRPSAFEMTFDRSERRITRLFFWYFMTQGIANAAIIIGGLKVFKLLP